MISYVIPTRDRPQRLKSTLLRLEALGEHAGGAEVIVVDNDSRERAILPRRLRNGLEVRSISLRANIGAAARNIAVKEADPRSAWIVMLDDDSYPIDLSFVDGLGHMAGDVAAVSADIYLSLPAEATDPRGIIRRESGGLPEVFIGCGVAVRRGVFERLGGYDPSFGYYAEEYDLAARMLIAGFRVQFEPSFRVFHAKDQTRRDMNVILERLVRNNGWVAQRYAPECRRVAEIRETRKRYRRIAETENAIAGYGRGLVELRRTIRSQRRTPMTPSQHDRFTGLGAAREALGGRYRERPFRTARIVDEGKNAWVVETALQEMGVEIIRDARDADVAVIGTMSPGPMLDAHRARSLAHRAWREPVITPWRVESAIRKRSLLAA